MKKCHKEPLTKSTISEVYAGMHARKGTTVTSLPVPYGNYGNLMRVILYNYTKDVVWIKTLPESQPALGIQSMRNRMIDEANLDFEQSQTYLDRASSLERKAREQRQKALDIQKSAVYRALQACSFFKKEHKQSSATANTLDDYTEYKNIHFYRLVCSPCFKTTLIKHVYNSFFNCCCTHRYLLSDNIRNIQAISKSSIFVIVPINIFTSILHVVVHLRQ